MIITNPERMQTQLYKSMIYNRYLDLCAFCMDSIPSLHTRLKPLVSVWCSEFASHDVPLVDINADHELLMMHSVEDSFQPRKGQYERYVYVHSAIYQSTL